MLNEDLVLISDGVRTPKATMLVIETEAVYNWQFLGEYCSHLCVNHIFLYPLQSI